MNSEYRGVCLILLPALSKTSKDSSLGVGTPHWGYITQPVLKVSLKIINDKNVIFISLFCSSLENTFVFRREQQ